MSEEKSGQASANGAVAPGKPIVLNAGEVGGSMSLDSFLHNTGEEIVDAPEDDEAPVDFEAIKEEQKAESEKKAKPEDSEEEKEEVVEEESEEDSEEEKEDKDLELDKLEASKTGKSLKVKANGKTYKIPDDAVIVHTVDGEPTEINLKEHLNVVAGEMTVAKRLSMVHNFYNDVKKEREAKLAEEKEIFGYLNEGKPEQALCALAEKRGFSPVEMYKTFLAHVDRAYEQFKDHTPDQIEAHFAKLEADWLKGKEKKRKEGELTKQQAEAFLQRANEEIEKEGLTQDQFTKAVSELEASEEWQNATREERLDAAIERGLLRKHESMVTNAIKRVNPKLLDNKKLIKTVSEVTNPHGWSEDEIAEAVREVVGHETKRIATSLSRKEGASASSTSEKKEGAKPKEKRSFASTSEMARHLLG